MKIEEIKQSLVWNRKRIVATCLSGILVLTSMSGCGKKEESISPVKEVEIIDEQTTEKEMPTIEEKKEEKPSISENTKEKEVKEQEQEYFKYYIDLSDYVGDSLIEALKECGY